MNGSGLYRRPMSPPRVSVIVTCFNLGLVERGYRGAILLEILFYYRPRVLERICAAPAVVAAGVSEVIPWGAAVVRRIGRGRGDSYEWMHPRTPSQLSQGCDPPGPPHGAWRVAC